MPVSTGQTYFDSATASQLSRAYSLRQFVLFDFTYCDMLNGAVFDGLVHLYPLGGSVGSINPKTRQLLELLESLAQKVTAFIVQKYTNVNLIEAKRYACYAVAEGNNPTANLSDYRFVVKIDPLHYFKTVMPVISRFQKHPVGRNRYLIAYLVTVSDSKGFDHLKEVLKELDDGRGLFLIHLDESFAERDQVQKYLASHSSSNGQRNVYLSTFKPRNIWGHVSKIFSQLRGFLELRELGEWDYLIHLSAYDWPLRKTSEIHRVLQLTPGFSWIDYWSDTDSVAKRIMRPHLGKADYSGTYHPPELGVTAFPFPHWRPYKQMEWMILSSGAIEFLLTDPVALNYLSFMEHAFLPEESYFATGASL